MRSEKKKKKPGSLVLTSPYCPSSSAIIENGGRTITKTGLKSGMSAVFPQGLLHYQLNLGCKRARLLAALANEDAGTLSFPSRLLEIKTSTLSLIFGLNTRSTETLQRTASLAKIQSACLRMCGLK